MLIPILIFAGSYLAGEIYKKYATPQQKSRWENFAKMHHGEAGAIMTGAGILTRSPNLTASGIGLMLHDRYDAGKWFKNR
ncbi:hypothetical protein SCCGRSA3_00227 [Marine Group I thaumarchaeote SCGC RSA3]|uniref:Uncharacterized protein n=2 Tax=Marine Group I TaxID=905826 RepID=A0A081RQG0_9ARCH|nr:hypothetical protein AAA799N04_00125 [Marine Group I thaumarchaeote SCGC AAA799-N04]KFM20413.1 hypothetical protein SCCGRSA3_00227 [Marine Group I thaumarchaeote SCGC RSA3]